MAGIQTMTRAGSRPSPVMYSEGSPLSGNNRITAEVVTVTPALAEKWLSECNFEHQRRLRPWHVDELSYALSAGQFKPGCIEFYHYQHHVYLTDGQHRLNAILESGIPAVLVVLRVHVDSKEEIARAYYQTDCGLIRPLSEAIPMSGIMEETGLTEKEVQIVASATRFIQFGFTDKASSGKRLAERNRDVRLQAVRMWGAAAQKYFVAIEDRDDLVGKAMLTMAPVAVGIVTCHYQPERAAEFWGLIAGNDGLRKGTPEQSAFSLLASAAKEKMALNLYSRKLACCWNAFYDRRDLKVALVRDPRKPLFLKGTPYDGVQVLRYGPDMELIKEEE